ncbi:MAG TPA: XamI family restriction endonuclease [Thermoanaerobaculaceae bacterium]|nr:XamI family restriction endonuclease [Thermoanaerobaculaceae bacterium]
MAVNADKPTRWKNDIASSVDLYNEWFLAFAPDTYRATRVETTKQVAEALRLTGNLRFLAPATLAEHPAILPMLRMATAPPIARDRLVGLARVNKTLVHTMENEQRVPPRMKAATLKEELRRVAAIILRLADRDLFTWLEPGRAPTAQERFRASTIVADRLCGAMADPIVRNAQERRQLAKIKVWLEAKKYRYLPPGDGTKLETMAPGTFTFRLNVPAKLEGGATINIPVDTVVMPGQGRTPSTPLLIEAKSAGDFTNVNKRRKEEAAKMAQLRANYGKRVRYILFLCGYFDSGYLGYEAAEGIDWVWEHRMDDLDQFGL